jgi:hypothetical protein
VLAFGCATTSDEQYLAHAVPTIERLSEESSLLMRRHGQRTIHEPYNEMLDEAATRDDLEAVVLLHQDVSIDDPHFAARVRALLAADERIAVIGVVGARRPRGLAWWEGEAAAGTVASPCLTPTGDAAVDYGIAAREVEAVDGIVLVLSAWAARDLRFDPALGPFDGYDADICLQARALGGRVVVGDFPGVAHHVDGDAFFDRDRWVRGSVALSRKWDPAIVGTRL